MIQDLNYLNKKESIEKIMTESSLQYDQRIVFIQKLESHKLNFKEAIRLSKIWYCIKFKKCKYYIDLYNTIMEYDK